MPGPTAAPSVLVPQAASVAQLDELLRSNVLSFLSFTDYSVATFQDPQAMLECAATALGIGAVYAVARHAGFVTIGTVSSLARTHHFALSPCVDTVLYVEDRVWGGLGRYFSVLRWPRRRLSRCQAHATLVR